MITLTRVESLRDRARRIQREAHVLYLAARDPRMPTHAKLLALLVAGYALSPIDLIPDFIPVFGYVDDLVLVPLGIMLVLRLVPPQVLTEHRRAVAAAAERPRSRIGAVIVGTSWLIALGLVVWLVV